jgi:hypothetical protein
VDAAVEDFREHGCRVAHESNRQWSSFGLGRHDALERIVKVVRHFVQVPVIDSALNSVGIDVHHENGTVLKGHGQRLCATHAPATAGQCDGAGESAVEVFARNGTEGFVRPL